MPFKYDRYLHDMYIFPLPLKPRFKPVFGIYANRRSSTMFFIMYTKHDPSVESDEYQNR